MPPFRRVVIETTGLADPAPILQTLMAHPYLVMRFRLDGVVTLVDAINGGATLDTQEEARRQVAVADRLVLAKTDLATTPDAITGLARLRARLRALNPAAPILDVAREEATAGRLLGAGPFSLEGKTSDIRGWLNAESYTQAEHGHAHGRDFVAHSPAGQHAHDVNRHDASIRAFCLTAEAPVAPAAFDMFLELLRAAHGPKLLRVKGLVALADDAARPVVVQGVQHVFHPPLRLDAWPDADRRTRMVFIVRDLPHAFVEGLWAALTGAPASGQADLAALAANPLAPGRSGLLR